MNLKTEQIAKYTDAYFIKTTQTIASHGINPVVLFQVFQKKEGIMAGGAWVQALLQDVSNIELWLLPDGSPLVPGEPVMYLKGFAQDIVPFETSYLGNLARSTRIASNVNRAVKAANGKPVLFFPARFDASRFQYHDGWAAAVGGAASCSTEEQMAGWNAYHKKNMKPTGTMPHALIGLYDGDTAAASMAYAETYPGEDVWPLVDFTNDCARTAAQVFKAFRDRGKSWENRLAGVRLDTSEKNIDFGLLPPGVTMEQMLAEESAGDDRPGKYTTKHNGVCPSLVEHVRRQLNLVGGNNVKICVSGGFTDEKIRRFEQAKVPVDVYAIGESFLSGAQAFTSDMVAKFDGFKMIPIAKMGRAYIPSDRPKRVI